MLMKKLGLQVQQEVANDEELEAYARLFDHPLPPSHISALAALFGWSVPNDAAVSSAAPAGAA